MADAAAPPAAAAGQLSDRVASLFAITAASLGANLLGAAIVFGLYRGLAADTTLLLWEGAFALLFGLRVVMLIGYRRVAPVGDAANAPWLKRWNTAALSSGALWGTAAWLFYGLGDTLQRIALVMMVNSFCIGSLPLLAGQGRIFTAFISLAFLPLVARIALGGEPHSLVLAGILLLIFATTVLLGRDYRRSFDRLVELKERTQHLLEQLQIEKAAADAARRDAETANRAKTQFFAAASHDLRQPLHAVGLFAEALRGKSEDDEVVHLVNSINASVDALEGLFSELLDITRIDTGGVEARPMDFALEEVLRKLRLDFEPVAFEKGLALRVRTSRHFVHADPLLVERVLRNLTANAIRYTEDGGVLIGARRRGAAVLVQVWDSGVGIARPDRERIFEEFVQITDKAPALEPHQRKGLGLGLAIVRRLCALMQAALKLDSVPGRGSVFSVTLPLGKPPREPALAASRPALGLTLNRRLIVVVEDDLAVKDGIEVLLKSWGASVIAFDSLAACRQWAEAAEPALLKPDLLVADYRLESGHTGVEVIELMREHFGEKLPALVVTGSMMTGHEALAQAHGFHMLLKPVLPNKLRAMIGFKLGLR